MGDALLLEGGGEGQITTAKDLRGLLPSLPMKRNGKSKSGYLDGIFGPLGDLEGPPGVPDR